MRARKSQYGHGLLWTKKFDILGAWFTAEFGLHSPFTGSTGSLVAYSVPTSWHYILPLWWITLPSHYMHLSKHFIELDRSNRSSFNTSLWPILSNLLPRGMKNEVEFSITDSRRVHPTVDPKTRLWTDVLPQSFRPFIQLSRIDMLSGSLLMFWPSGNLFNYLSFYIDDIALVWGVIASFYFIGSVLLHSIACTWNDVCDKDLDAQVERTKHRPLPAGSVSVRGALLFALGQIVCFISFLWFLSNPLAIRCSIFGLCVWQPVYPFLKRITYWPQAWLPFVMNWGMVIAWVENVGQEGLDVLSTFFLASCCWSIYYDTVYATMDVKDDVKIGIKSTAVLFASWTRHILGVFCAGFVVLLSLAGAKNEQGIAYFGISILVTLFLLTWQLYTWEPEDPRSSFTRFDMNGRWIGKIVAMGLMADYLLTSYK